MNKKVMLELPDGSRRWGYATTENSASSYGQPVIVLDDNAYGVADIQAADIKVITNDTDTVNSLKKSGYSPISRNSTKIHKGIAFPPELAKLIEADAERESISFSSKVVQILENYYMAPAMPNQQGGIRMNNEQAAKDIVSTAHQSGA